MKTEQAVEQAIERIKLQCRGDSIANVNWLLVRGIIMDALCKEREDTLKCAAQSARDRFNGGGKWHGEQIAKAIEALQ